MSTFSIYNDLLGDSPSMKPGAIRLVRLLLQVAANTAVDAPNNLFTGFSIVKTAREACDAIQKNLEDIDTLGDDPLSSDEEAWKVFDNNVGYILDLERRLLNSDLLASTHKSIQEVESVGDYLLVIKDWAADRDRLEQELKHLHEILKGVTKSTDSRFSDSEKKCDDAAMLRKLVSNLKEPASNPDGAKAAVDELKEKLRGHDLSNEDSDHRAYCIKAAWVVHAAVLELDKTSDPERKNHLVTKKVWDGVIRFADFLASGNSAINTEYDTLETLLRDNQPLPPHRYLTLVKTSRGVFGPFTHQTRVLVRHCKTMVKKYSSPENAMLAALHYTLAESVLGVALAAVKEAIEISDSDSTSAATEAFKTAIDKLRQLPVEYQDDTGIDADMQDATTKDNNHYSLVKARITSPAAARPVIGPSQDVIIKLGDTGAPVTVKVPNNTKIGALVWSNEGYTGAKTSGNWVDPQKTVKDAAPGDGPFELVLTN